MLGFSGGDAEERLRLRVRSEESIVSVSCASTGVEVEDWVRLVGGCGCAVETDAGRRLGLERTVGWSVVSGEVVRGLVSSSRMFESWYERSRTEYDL